VRAAARLLAVGWLFHFKMISRSSFDAFLGVLWPLFFATVAFFMFRAGGGEETLLYASLGAAVMGIWSVTSTSAGAAMQRERWHGTLEVLVASPAPFALVLLPITIAMTTIGLYCMLATLLWGRLLFGIELRLEQPLLFALSLPVAIVSIGTFGFLLAVAFVRYRFAWALGNLFEYPVWLICGFLVPLTLLPEWVRPISWLLAPTWGMRAIRESALGGSPLPDLALCLALAGGYTLAGILVLDSALKAARARASLSLT
jgi:ABC-2 type transport system permease protein